MPAVAVAGASAAATSASLEAAAAEEAEKAKPNFGLTGVLRQDAATGNTYKGREMKFVEPPDAAMPSVRWRLHEFRGGVQSEKPLHIHRQTAFLFGKDPEIADILTAHPTCSRQHAVLQYRLVEVEDAHARGGARRVVKPYIMDLESTNGTMLNGERVDDSRYIELKAMDTLRFGESSREYVLLHDGVQ
jgi:smad nuclear-interacting protein 1